MRYRIHDTDTGELRDEADSPDSDLPSVGQRWTLPDGAATVTDAAYVHDPDTNTMFIAVRVRMDKGASQMEFKPGQRVKVVQQGTLKIGNVTLTDNVFEGVTILGKNPDGTYRVSLRGLINAPGTDDVSIPAEWIHPL